MGAGEAEEEAEGAGPIAILRAAGFSTRVLGGVVLFLFFVFLSFGGERRLGGPALTAGLRVGTGL